MKNNSNNILAGQATVRKLEEELATTRAELQRTANQLKSVTKELRAAKKKLKAAESELAEAEKRMSHAASFPVVNPNAIIEINLAGRVIFSNPAAWKILNDLGLEQDDVTVFLPADIKAILQGWDRKGQKTLYREVTLRDRIFGENIYLVPQFGVARIYTFDITERKWAEALTQARLRLVEAAYGGAMSVDDLLRLTLDAIEAATGSTIGFYHFLEADQETLSLRNWSTNTMATMCAAEGKGSHYNISKAGVWVDCVRERRPVIHNDYASLPRRKGMPPGHAPVVREMVVPIFRGERIVAIIGVGNKPEDYDSADIETALLLGDFSWEIVERKLAEEALRRSEHRHRSFIEVTSQWAWVTDPVGLVVEDIPALRGFTGQTCEQAKGAGWADALHPDDLQRTLRVWNQAVASRTPYETEYRMRRHDGVYRLLLARGVPIVDQQGNVTEWVGTCIDITERRAAEEALREHEQQLRVAELTRVERQRFYDVLEELPVYVVLLSPDYHVPFANRFFRERFGEAHGRPCYEYLFGRFEPCEICETFKVLKTGAPREWEWTGPDGRNYAIFDRPFKGVDGSTLILEMGIDITERKVAEAELEKHRNHLEELIRQRTSQLESANAQLLSEIAEREKAEEEASRLNKMLKALGNSRQAMIRAENETGYLNDVCRVIVEDCGYSMVWIGLAEQDEEKSVWPVASAGFESGYLETLNITWADSERGRGPTGTAIRTGRMTLCRNMRTDPAFTPWREEAIRRGYSSSVVFPLLAGSQAFGAISIYSSLEDPFAEGEVKLLAELADDLAYGIMALRVRAAHARAQQAILHAKQEWERTFDAVPDLIAILDKGHRIVRANRAMLEKLGPAPVQCIGNQCYTWVHGTLSPPQFCPHSRTLKDGRQHMAEVREDRLGGDFLVTTTPLFDEDGQMTGTVHVARDITERKQAEQEVRKLNEDLNNSVLQLEAANRELEAFSYSVSHDLRAPLRSVAGFSQALLEDYGNSLDTEGRDSLDRILAGTTRMGEIIDDLLNLSRVTRAGMRRGRVDLSTQAARIAENLARSQPERQVDFVIAPEMIAEGDEHLLKLALENLLGNAFKFTARQPAARVEFGVAKQEGKQVYFIRDNGAGFDMNYSNKLFKPFQRLHTMHEFTGTGIGLATVRRIINRHGGTVRIEGEPGKGAVVYFTL